MGVLRHNGVHNHAACHRVVDSLTQEIETMGFLERILGKPVTVVPPVPNGERSVMRPIAEIEADNLVRANAEIQANSVLREECKERKLGMIDHEYERAIVGRNRFTIYHLDSCIELDAFGTYEEALSYVRRLTPQDDGTYTLDTGESTCLD